VLLIGVAIATRLGSGCSPVALGGLSQSGQ